jgi:poly(A) polymerase
MIRLYGLLFESKETSALEYLSKLIQNSPFAGKVFLAGGAVRDEILGKPVKDIDIVVAMPDGGIEFANWITRKIGAYRQGANPVIYPRFGTAKFNLRGANHNGVDLSGVDIESVMTRGEKYETGSRKPEVVYADLKADAERRDLTVNSLFKDLVTGEIKDLTGRGISDIKNGVVRTPLDPDTTFSDDPLRMLRAVRFAVKYNWKMPLSLVKALKRNADQLKNISTERIQDEFNKILMTNQPDVGLRLLSYTGLNEYIVPELDMCRGVKQNEHHDKDVFDHILEVIKNTPPDLTARLSALFHDIAKPQTKSTGEDGRVHFYEHEDRGAEMAAQIMQRLKYSNETINSVSNIVQNHMRMKTFGRDGEKATDKSLRKFMSALGDDLNSALMMMQSDNVSHKGSSAMPSQIPALKQRMETLASQQPSGARPVLPINGHDIMKALNIKPGPILKNILKAIEDVWYENPNLDAETAIGIAKAAYDQASIDNGPNGIMTQKIRNPETDNDILVKTALKYPDDHPAKIAALKLLEK